MSSWCYNIFFYVVRFKCGVKSYDYLILMYILKKIYFIIWRCFIFFKLKYVYEYIDKIFILENKILKKLFDIVWWNSL